jgi:MFS family permease
MKKKRQALISLVITGILHGIIHTLSSFLSPLNGEIARYFNLEAITGVSAFKTSYLMVYAVSNLVFGALTNRISARIILSAGTILNAAAVMAFRFVPPGGIVLMHVLWIVAAIGGGVYHPVANAFITRLYPQRKGWALGITGMGSGIGFAFGPFLTGFLSSAALLSWRDISLVFGVLALVCGLAASLWIRDEAPLPRNAAASAAHLSPEMAQAVPRQGCTPFGLGYALWGLLFFMIVISGAREIGIWSILDISDFYLSGVLPQANTAWFLFFMYLPGIFMQPFIGTLSDRIGRKKLSVIALCGYGGSIIAAALVPGGFLLIPYFLMGATQSPTTPLLEAFVADYTTPATRGIIFGVYITAITGIGALGPLCSGIFLDVFGRTPGSFRLLLCIIGGCVVLGGLLMTASGLLVRKLGLRAEKA